MTKIVVNIISINILHIEVLIALRHRMNLGNMGYNLNASCYLTCLVNQSESVISYLWPFCSNAMQIPPLRKELPTHSIGRDDDFCLLIMLQEVPQATCMVAMPMRNENIIDIAEIDAQTLCISNQHIACPRIKQELMMVGCQKD